MFNLTYLLFLLLLLLLLQVTYEIVGENDPGGFRIDGKTGEIFVTETLSKANSMYHINVSARDGGGLR